MITSAIGRRLIEAFEGKRLRAYQDGGGVWTIGYGHTSAAGAPHVVPGMTITDAQADEILSRDLRVSEIRVEKYVTVPLTQNEFDALVSFDFNTGAIHSGSVDDKLNRGDKAAALATLLQYDHDNGRVVSGLERRRQAEKLLFEGKVQPALDLAGVHEKIGAPTPKVAQKSPSEHPTEPQRSPQRGVSRPPAMSGHVTSPKEAQTWLSVIINLVKALLSAFNALNKPKS